VQDPDWSSMGSLLSSSITASVGLAEGAVQLYHNKYMAAPDWFKVRAAGGGGLGGGGKAQGGIRAAHGFGQNVAVFASRWCGVLQQVFRCTYVI
jgi:hypothetical protein